MLQPTAFVRTTSTGDGPLRASRLFARWRATVSPVRRRRVGRSHREIRGPVKTRSLEITEQVCFDSRDRRASNGTEPIVGALGGLAPSSNGPSGRNNDPLGSPPESDRSPFQANRVDLSRRSPGDRATTERLSKSALSQPTRWMLCITASLQSAVRSLRRRTRIATSIPALLWDATDRHSKARRWLGILLISRRSDQRWSTSAGSASTAAAGSILTVFQTVLESIPGSDRAPGRCVLWLWEFME